MKRLLLITVVAILLSSCESNGYHKSLAEEANRKSLYYSKEADRVHVYIVRDSITLENMNDITKQIDISEKQMNRQKALQDSSDKYSHIADSLLYLTN